MNDMFSRWFALESKCYVKHSWYSWQWDVRCNFGTRSRLASVIVWEQIPIEFSRFRSQQYMREWLVVKNGGLIKHITSKPYHEMFEKKKGFKNENVTRKSAKIKGVHWDIKYIWIQIQGREPSFNITFQWTGKSSKVGLWIISYQKAYSFRNLYFSMALTYFSFHIPGYDNTISHWGRAPVSENHLGTKLTKDLKLNDPVESHPAHV